MAALRDREAISRATPATSNGAAPAHAFRPATRYVMRALPQ